MKGSSAEMKHRGRTPAGELLSRLPEVFGVRELEKFLRYPAQWLVRSTASGKIVRLQRGTYWNRYRYPGLTVPYLACHIREAPSYISCEWALHDRGILLQRPFVCSVVTLSTSVGRERQIRLMDETIEFSHISKRLFWGFESVEGYFLATAEKAYLDTLYYGRDPEEWGELEKDALNPEALRDMAEKFPQWVVKFLVKFLGVRH